MDKLTVESRAYFIWSFSTEFFLVTGHGNYVWSSPDQGGTGEIRPTSANYDEWCRELGIDFGRSKGHHLVKDYCGPNVKIQA